MIWWPGTSGIGISNPRCLLFMLLYRGWSGSETRQGVYSHRVGGSLLLFRALHAGTASCGPWAVSMAALSWRAMSWATGFQFSLKYFDHDIIWYHYPALPPCGREYGRDTGIPVVWLICLPTFHRQPYRTCHSVRAWQAKDCLLLSSCVISVLNNSFLGQRYEHSPTFTGRG